MDVHFFEILNVSRETVSRTMMRIEKNHKWIVFTQYLQRSTGDIVSFLENLHVGKFSTVRNPQTRPKPILHVVFAVYDNNGLREVFRPIYGDRTESL